MNGWMVVVISGLDENSLGIGTVAGSVIGVCMGE